jgi:hypothetical protein
MGLTTDSNDPGLRKNRGDGQNEVYLILSEEERAKGFVRPVRHRYRHLACGTVTTMGQALCETYARDPKFYGATFCCNCGSHFPLRSYATERRELDLAKESLTELLRREPVDGQAFAAAQARIRNAEAAYQAAERRGGWQFEWQPDGDPVGSDVAEAAAYLAERERRKAEKHAGGGI